MTIASEIERIQNNVSKAYSSCSAKGAAMPEKQNTENLPATIDSIKSGSGSGALARYEVVDGVAQPISSLKGDKFADITSVKDYGLYYAFFSCTGLTGEVSFPALESVGDSGLWYAFNGCTSLTGEVSFPVLTSVGDGGLGYAFQDCKSLTSVSFPMLTSVGVSGLEYAFSRCTGLTSVSFPMLTSVGVSGLHYAFFNCTSLTSVSFPALTSVEEYGLEVAFGGLPNITLHFRKDMESTISQQSGYPEFGADNATVLFDL